jgi:hypothetical protein
MTPTPQQKAFLDSPARFRALLGGVGSGCTWAGAQEAIRVACLHPGATIAVARSAKKGLWATAWAELRAWLPPAAITEQDFRLPSLCVRLKNGSKFVGWGSMRPSDLQGIELDAAWLDQPADLPDPELWRMLCARVRRGRAGPNRAWATGWRPPEGWVCSEFVTSPENEMEVFPIATRDDPYLPEGYAEAMERMGF